MKRNFLNISRSYFSKSELCFKCTEFKSIRVKLQVIYSFVFFF